MAAKLIADSGSTKCEWCMITPEGKKTIITTGISPYFLSKTEIINLLKKELLPFINAEVTEIFFYGTGLGSVKNIKILANALNNLFPAAIAEVKTDLLGAARGVCGNSKGIVCILGTGSNSCFYNGIKIVKNSSGLGFILGDEGSGAYLGKKVIQHYLYNIFDEDLRAKFDARFVTTSTEILENVYKKPLPNRYLASFAIFLSENRGHYMVENIIEDGLNDFFLQHVVCYPESKKFPVHFIGSVAFGFQDVIEELCATFKFDTGKILKTPMEGLIQYHTM